jgi:hypothetical protein
VQVEGQHPESASIDLNAGQTINVVAIICRDLLAIALDSAL